MSMVKSQTISPINAGNKKKRSVEISPKPLYSQACNTVPLDSPGQAGARKCEGL